ncbi:MAG: ABC transporter ATP-binding protein [Planctomycetes bacterium]|nr:ABC transporter ATP-binding protein [Planctomycetota bacterium]
MSDPYAEPDPDGRMQWAILGRLWPYVRPYRRGFAACLLILLVSFSLELLGPWCLRHAIDGPMRQVGLATDERLRQLTGYGLGFLAATLCGAGLGYVYGLWTAWNGQRVIRDVRRQLFDHLLHTSLAHHERQTAGKLTTRVTSDVENLNELLATGVLQSVFDLLKIFGVLAVLFWLDVPLALFTLGTAPVVIGLSLWFRAKAQRAYRAVRGKLALQNAYTTELVGGIRTTRAFGQEAAVAQRYAGRNADTATAWLGTVLHFSRFFALVDLALRGTTIGLLWFGGHAVLDGRLEPGQFVQFWLYYGLFSGPVKELGEKYNVLQAAFASAERVFGLLAEPVFPPPNPRAQPSPRRGRAQVHFEAVDFAYVPGHPVLRSVSFTAAPGETIAIVGPTGAGKTTILSLVARLRDVSGGAVRLDGTDVRELQVRDLRQRIAYVAQDLFLFHGTVLDNVRLFDPAIPEAKVWQALETVGAAAFVRALPAGLGAQVEERGATFSQGQRQLLAFARALVTDPDVLVLDEATASIDSEAEAALQQALRAALHGRTALVVAHRLSTVREADRILVLDQGRIVEAGSHRELVAQRGAYHHMLNALGPAATEPLPP